MDGFRERAMATTTRKSPGNLASIQTRTRRAMRTQPRAAVLAVSAALMPWIWVQPAAADPAPSQLPTGGQVTAGTANISTSGSKMQIDQATDKAILNWQTFSIGSSAWVNFSQPSASSVALNRVLGNNPSEIFGRLSANGQVFLSNPSGVLFAPSASVDVGSLFATSLSITDQDFLAGRYNFYNAGNAGAVVNQAALNASAINAGTIQADGGRVLLTARSANALLDTVVNNSGIIRANSLVSRNGEIILDGGTAGVVSNSGTLQAVGLDAGTIGGTVKVLGQYAGLFSGTRIDVSGDAGGGTVLVGGNFHGAGTEQSASRTYVDGNASINADAVTSGNGGQVAVWSNDGTQFYGSISASGGAHSGDGGFVEVSGKHGLDFRGTVNTSASNGSTGTLLLDPTEITIIHSIAGPDIGITVTGSAPFVDTATAPAVGGTLTDFTINSQLGSNNVVVLANGAGGDGNVAFNAASGGIVITSGGTTRNLTFDATNNISFTGALVAPNTTVSLSGGQLTLRAGAGSITQSTAANTLRVNSTGLLMIAGTGIGVSAVSPFRTLGLTD